jgi:hypothetical protein
MLEGWASLPVPMPHMLLLRQCFIRDVPSANSQDEDNWDSRVNHLCMISQFIDFHQIFTYQGISPRPVWCCHRTFAKSIGLNN